MTVKIYCNQEQKNKEEDSLYISKTSDEATKPITCHGN